MDDLDASLDLCEQHGLPGPADALRDLAAGRVPIYVVRSRVEPADFEFSGLDPADFADARAAFRDRDEAERAARAASARALRGQRETEYLGFSGNDYCRRVGAILGAPYQFPGPGEPSFPAGATDDQLLEICALGGEHAFGLDGSPLFEVVEIAADSGTAPAAPAPAGPAADELLAGSDLCEEHHLLRQAAMLRALAGAGGTAYVVAERDVDYNDEHMYVVDDDGQPRNLHFDRAEAEAAAGIRNAAWLRGLPLEEYGLNLDDFTSTGTVEELNREVGAALGIEFDLWACEPDACPFPAEATDAQMVAVSDAFDRLRPFRVMEVEFGGGPGGGARGGGADG